MMTWPNDDLAWKIVSASVSWKIVGATTDTITALTVAALFVNSVRPAASNTKPATMDPAPGIEAISLKRDQENPATIAAPTTAPSMSRRGANSPVRAITRAAMTKRTANSGANPPYQGSISAYV